MPVRPSYSPKSRLFASPVREISDLMLVGDEVVCMLSPEERDDLRRLEEAFSRGQRESIAALREIRARKLYRQDFPSFDDYVEMRWHKTRQWATQRINWLRRIELLVATGKDPYQSLTVDDTQALGPLEDYPELFVQAIAEVEEEARRSNKKRGKKHLQEAVKRLVNFKSLQENVGVPDITYAESCSLSRLGSDRRHSPNLVEEAKTAAEAENHPLVDCLVDVCKTQHGLPKDQHLLAVARGTELETLVQPLAALRAQWDEIDELKKEQRTLADKLAAVNRKLAPEEPSQNKATWLTPKSSGASTVGGEEKPGPKPAEEEPEQEEGRYRVRVTGDFEQLVERRDFVLPSGYSVDEIAYLLESLAETIRENGVEITVESSLTITPLVEDDVSKPDDKPDEDLGDEKAGAE